MKCFLSGQSEIDETRIICYKANLMSSILKNPSSKFSKIEKYNNKKVVAGLVNDLKI